MSQVSHFMTLLSISGSDSKTEESDVPILGISESFLTVKGAALFLPRGNGSSPSSASRFSQLRSKHAGTAVRGFSVSTDNRVHVFKPVSVQAMWSALQSLHKACEVARCHNYYPGSLFLTWVSYYQSRVSSDPITHQRIRTELEVHMVCNLREFKEYIDNEMILILGQMDSPTEIFDHVYLGSEWNASNLEELQNSGVQYILNVTKEIDNFFPGVFEYHNIRVRAGAKCLVHCKMGVSRSASTVIAYAMKEYGWDLERAFDHVKERHSDLSEHHEPLCKTAYHPNTLGRSDPRNQGNSPTAPSLQELLHPSLGTPSNTGQVVQSVSECGTPSSAGKVVRSSSQPNTTVTRTEAQLTSTTGVQSVGSGDQSSHTVDQSAPSGDQSSHTVDQSAPSGDQSSHTVDQSAPSGVQSSHTVDQSAPSGVQSSHTVDQSAPSGDQSSHTVDQSAPSGDQSSHTVDQSAPSGDQSSHTVDQSVPSGVQSLDSPDSAPLAGSACPPSSPPLSNGLCDSEEDPSTQSLPRPRAATVVPDVSTVTVVETVPVGRPHLPPSLHHLPLSAAPFPTPSGADETLKAKEPSSNLPGQKSRQSQVPELLLKTPVTSRQTAGSQEQFAPVPYEKRHSDQRLPGVFLGSSGPQQPSSSEVLIISQPSAPLQDPVAEGSSALSTDRINFFSAREKFQDMTRDGRTRCFSDQALQQTPQPIPRVTELESLMHTVAPSPGPSSQPESTASQDQEMCQSDQEVEEKVAKSQQEVKAVKEEVKDKAKEMEAASHSPPTPLSGDWAMGSVRRVTRQLEQRMRQEHGSPSPTPPSLPLDPSHHPASITPRHTAFCYAPLSSVDFLCLEGVTELESGTNWGRSPGRGRGDIMRETREMGAFRRQESGDGAKEPRCMGQVWGEGVEARQKGSRGGDRQRAREMEARIRRAGLTPPSLMKRSASLAKLGCLELSANDLSGWELSPTVEPFPPLVAADESSKKLRVLSHNAPCLTSSVSTSRPESLRTGGEGPCKGGHTPSEHLHSPPPDSGHAPSPMPDLIVVATRQQYGRTHPLHRLKKQTVSTFYHTM
ncbi:unnamed protein product [Coregonus sp. 'balchen']|nr:unnamed protein product [Coregonus sp. 'balchen']